MFKFIALLLLLSSGAIAALSLSQNGFVDAQTAMPNDDVANPKHLPERAPVAAPADRPGYPHVNYRDPQPGLASRPDGSTVICAVSADLDGDGIADLATADTAGNIRVIKGNAAALFPAAERRDADVNYRPDAFVAERVEGTLPFVPDDLLIGDFNADGHRDVIAVKLGAEALVLLAGDGRGHFAGPANLYLPGAITAAEAGEIGRPDGQTDVAVGYVVSSKAYLAVFEHPEGAFSHNPEIFALSGTTDSVAIGKFDFDDYSDVAAASGNTLTVVHERGQAYPLDMLPEANIQRPPAEMQSTQLPFAVHSMVSAEMNGTRGDGLAILAADGSLHYFKPANAIAVAARRPRALLPLRSTYFVPARTEKSAFVQPILKGPTTAEEADAAGQLMANTDDLRSRGLDAILRDRTASAEAARQKMPAAARAEEDAAKAERQAALVATRKRLFEAGLAAKPVAFSNWKMEDLANGQKLPASGSVRLQKARVSASGVDDILLTDRAEGGISVIGRWIEDGQRSFGKAHVATLSSGSQPSAVVPMRLNVDARGDLAVFNVGSSTPNVILSQPSTVLTVNTADDIGGGNCQDDGQPCGIRRAIFWANLIPDSMITFNIPGAGVHTIHLASALPDLHSMTIDATTQPGYAGTPLIELKGDLLAGGAIEGFRVTKPNTVIRGFAINQMPGIESSGSIIGGSGIVLLSYIGETFVTNVTIESNFLGTDPTGTVAEGNDGNGVQVYNADNNLIGGAAPQARNILSGNGNYPENKSGVGFAITGGNGNRVFGNYVGTDVTGTLRVSNSDGALVTGVGNQIGGDEPGQGNVISGNGTPPNEFGRCVGGGLAIFQLYNADTAAPLTNSTTVKGNLVGTNASGTAAVYNCTQGLSSSGNLNTFIGSITEGGRNTVSGNKYDGIWCGFNDSSYFPISGGCSIEGNNIGTNVAGDAAIPNSGENTCVGFCLVTETVWMPTSGIDFAVLGSPGGTTPGGPCTGFCNLISGNYGLWLDGGSFQKSGTGFGLIINNYIGTNRAGNAALPNFSGGIGYYGSALIGVTFGDGQGGFVPGGNLISANYAQGVAMSSTDGGGLFWIKGNTIGVSADGLSPLPNGTGGTESAAISLHSQAGTVIQIGGTNPLDRNYLTNETNDGTASRGHGIRSYANPGSTIAITGNYIGVDPHGNPAPNSGDGIDAQGTGHTIIGGGGLGNDNLIANNGRNGVFIYNYASPFSNTDTAGVTVRQNVIKNNGALGIDLTNVINGGGSADPDGVTPNDCQDLDTGANGLQNYPELYAPVQNPDGTLRIDTTLKSLPNRQFTIDYYLNDQADPTNYGEGQTWLGTGTMITNGNSFASSSFNTTQQLPPTAIITATATDQDGNTSEFSCAAGVCTAAQNFEQAVANGPTASFCIQPIVVTTTGNEDDLDGQNPVQNRDGLCDVDANTAGEQCTLRAAIQEANARPGFDLINFEIPGPGVQTITVPLGQPLLPKIKEKVEINGASQSDGNGHPFIQISGEIQGQQAPLIGLQIATSDAVVRGLALNRFANNIVIGDTSGSFSNNSIESCYVGINADGSYDANGGSDVGISMGGNVSFANNRIGNAYGGNVISNNQVGILMGGASVANNIVAGNKIGTDPTGTTAIPNITGIILGSFAHDNTIGGDLNSDRNVISGNFQDGISIGTNATNNKVQGNYIGTRSDGEFALPNGVNGVKLITRANANIIGGPGTYGNIISGNGGVVDPNVGFQIAMDASTFGNKVFGNVIGLKRSGSDGLGGIVGVGMTGSSNTIGGEVNSPNIIGSQKIGISISSDGASDALQNTISYNRIGINNNGTIVANMIGVALDGATKNTSIAYNTISGNTAYGVLVRGSSAGTPSNNTIGQNKIGTDRDGNNAAPNGAGIVLYRTTGNTVAQNVISGNGLFGVFIGEDFDNAAPGFAERSREALRFLPSDGTTTFTSNNTVKGNRIGINAAGDTALPNGYTGVQLGENARNNLIGGNRRTGDGNYIGGHTVGGPKAGVYIGSIFTDPGDERLPRDNKVQGNFIGWGPNSAAIANGSGIYISGAASNVIGADPECQAPDCNGSSYANYISNSNVAAITFDGEGTIDNNVHLNYLGIDPNAFTMGGINAIDGIYYKAAQHNTISDNVIAGAGRDGVRVEGHRSFTLEDNYIGGNEGNGINVDADADPGPHGQTRPKTRPNTVVKTRANGRVNRPTGFASFLLGNSIGQLKIGENIIQAVNGLNGINAINVADLVIGASESGRRTIVTNSTGSGINITGGNTSNVQVINSTVGTDSTGEAHGNGGDGIKVDGATGVVVGGAGAGNVVAGNSGNGIAVENASTTQILGNSVGIVPMGSSVPLANQKNGISIRNSTNTGLGGTFASIGNVVSANLQNGILLSGINSSANHILRNIVGTDAARALGIGNQQSGVRVTSGAHDNAIGDSDPSNANTISGNGVDGIEMDDDEDTGNGPQHRPAVTGTVNNAVRNNDIFGNHGVGINLGLGDNDAEDPDEGPNRGQNYPILSSFRVTPDGDACVQVSVNSDPANSNYGQNGLVIDFFVPDNQGQGARSLGSGDGTWTEANYQSGIDKLICLGNAAFLGLSANSVLTATATDADGNTSQFTPVAFAPTAAEVAVSGRVTGVNGRGISNAVLTITSTPGSTVTTRTNQLGLYTLNVPAGGVYALSVSAQGRSFSRSTIVVKVSSAIAGVDFMAEK